MAQTTPRPLRFREGMRVRNTSGATGLPIGLCGTVALVAGVHGKSIYCDPSRLMIFVRWDDGQQFGVFKWELERVK
jgi:hypothetical protein